MTTTPFPIEIEPSGPYAGIATIRLEQAGKPVVVLDQPLIQRIEATMKSLPRSILGLVLASASDRAFIAGADLKSIQELSDDQLHRYLRYGSRVFAMFASTPFPTAAAINGAALGGGLEIAMHCDGLIGAPPPERDGQPGKPYPVGLPEAGLQICPGWGGTNLLPARMDAGEAIRRTATGQPLTFDEARRAGLFEAVAPTSGELLTTAKAWLAEQRGRRAVRRDGAPRRWVGRGGVAAGVLKGLDAVRDTLGDAGPAQAVVAAIDTGLARGWQAALESERRSLVHLRNQPAGKEAIAAFFAKSKK